MPAVLSRCFKKMQPTELGSYLQNLRLLEGIITSEDQSEKILEEGRNVYLWQR